MKTREEFLKSLEKLKPNLYMLGEKLDVPVTKHPLLRAAAEVLANTYDGPYDSEIGDYATATSHLSGDRINRFTHIHQSQEDLYRKVIMTRLYCRSKVTPCIGRCTGCDALNALSIVAYLVDQEFRTNYYERFVEYLRFCQKEDLALACAATDVKGDRGLRPHEQTDPDTYVHMVEKRENGIVVRGAKHHISFSPVSHELLVLPTRAMTEKDRDYAISFALPIDSPGITFVCRPRIPFEDRPMDFPVSSKWNSVEPMIVFDDVFVPTDRVFLCGEWKYAGFLVEAFATYHRHSYAGCKSALGDLLVGAASLIAEYNGIERASHIREKIAELIRSAEIAYASGIAASYHGKKMQSGTYFPDSVLVNVGKYYSGTAIYKEFSLVHDIAGGIACNSPSWKDLKSPELGRWIDKYMKGKGDTPTEHRIRLAHLIEDLTVTNGGVWLVAGIHGGGSPMAEILSMLSEYDIELRKKIAKRFAGIE